MTNGSASSKRRVMTTLSNGGSIEAVVERAQHARRRAPDEAVLVGIGVEPSPFAVRQLALVLLQVRRVHQEAERRLEDVGHLVGVGGERAARPHEAYHRGDQIAGAGAVG